MTAHQWDCMESWLVIMESAPSGADTICIYFAFSSISARLKGSACFGGNWVGAFLCIKVRWLLSASCKQLIDFPRMMRGECLVSFSGVRITASTLHVCGNMTLAMYPPQSEFYQI